MTEEVSICQKQRKVITADYGEIEPGNIGEYIAHGGYNGLKKALLLLSPQKVCDEIIVSGLRGRGGAGFLTGLKWQKARDTAADKKYIVCNGEEGEPHRIIEGLTIAGYACGATQGYLYVRRENKRKVALLEQAIEDAKKINLVGDRILGNNFSFEIELRDRPGAFVCGEETALIATIEGKRGVPSPKFPHPAVSGIGGNPTVVNNVETLLNVPGIILNGAEWFREIGVAGNYGTKLVNLTGQVKKAGMLEIELGITLGEIIFGLGGGMADDKPFKAFQVGGPTGGFLDKEHLDLPLTFDTLQQAGTIMGNGCIVVLNEETCMVEVARYSMSFVQSESCGKCLPCREGTRQMLRLLQKIVDGKGNSEDIALLEELAEVVRDSSLCGLGKTGASSLLTNLRNFRAEYMAHVEGGICPAGSCKAFQQYSIDASKCKGCSKCSRFCPVGAISGQIKQPFVIDSGKCIKCGACVQNCPFGAIEH